MEQLLSQGEWLLMSVTEYRGENPSKFPVCDPRLVDVSEEIEVYREEESWERIFFLFWQGHWIQSDCGRDGDGEIGRRDFENLLNAMGWVAKDPGRRFFGGRVPDIFT
eukprot:c26417_g1_i1.p3 GENE.c26417_g1_i1~~c26417_g1_i1.p3  ORF type:complete len:108 (-),score=8.08 c26417_g1_i1:149-472(-)